jgi:4-amino-4-deoxy-L-arabinose transferase-like glycosyltransferase
MTATLLAPPVTVPTRARDRSWERPALLALLLGTAVLYLWDLGASGTANDFYASAVQAGTQSWKAMLFGSLDAGNAITVDKPAFFLWPMELAGRAFGFSSWSMLVPQALEGVAAVAVLCAAVRRISGPVAGLLAGLALALTPVAVLMFRFNNPDAMLVLLLTSALYAGVRAVETASGRWLALAGLLVGLGFITKMGQALLVLPAMGLTYLVAAPSGIGTRIRQLLVAGVAMVAGAGWWIALVELWPASSRPYIGGSTNNSVLELALGYNGLGRLLGNSNGGGMPDGGMGGNTSFGGVTGWGRLLRGQMATEISWLLPAALLALALGLYLTARRPRTDRSRAGLLLFGGSLLVTAVTFSFMQGVIHPYYTIALAPLVAAVLAITGRLLWEARASWTARAAAVALVETTVLWDVHLLGAWQPAVKALVVLASVVAVVGLLFGGTLRKAVAVTLVAATVAGLGGSAAYAVSTASHAHTGSLPSSGPVTAQGGGRGQLTATSSELTALLKATSTRWAAATSGSGSAAPLQLASGRPVMAVGGFNGGDDAPTLAQFQTWVAHGQVSYWVTGGQGFGGPRGGSAIASWVAAHFTATTVGGSTVYDLRSAAS